jgi:hypothetical protein
MLSPVTSSLPSAAQYTRYGIERKWRMLYWGQGHLVGSVLPGMRERLAMSRAASVLPTQQIAEFFARGPSSREIAMFQLSDETVAYVRELLYKNSAGTLTAEESQELDELVLLDRIVNLIRSRAVDMASEP